MKNRYVPGMTKTNDDPNAVNRQGKYAIHDDEIRPIHFPRFRLLMEPSAMHHDGLRAQSHWATPYALLA